jgi:SAM-dependent methyltransferase
VERPTWLSEGFDLDRPSAARVYDYLLGGSHNLAADRELAAQILAAVPDAALVAQANRAFLRRAVLYCVQAGVRQFLDLGSGIPTVGNVHEVAQRAAAECRVVYVDAEPVAVAHSQAILAGNDRVTVLRADLSDPDAILADPGLHALLNLDQPVAVLMLAVLPFIPDAADPAGIVARFRDAVGPGSHLVLSHGTADVRPQEVARLTERYRGTSTPVTMRPRQQIEEFFAGFELVDPGLVFVQQWRPDWLGEVERRPEWSSIYCGVGRKP